VRNLHRIAHGKTRRKRSRVSRLAQSGNLLNQADTWFDRLTTNGDFIGTSTFHPFVLSSSKDVRGFFINSLGRSFVVKKIKKKSPAGSSGWRGVPLALVVTALAGPRREGRDVLRPFSPAWRLREIFLDHFSLEVVSTDRPLTLAEFTAWPGLADPAWAFKSAGGHGVVLTKAPVDEVGEGPRLGAVPVVVRLMASDLDRLSDLWAEDFPEVARVALTAAFTEAMNLIPGYDRAVWTGPRPARDLNALINHLNALVADECAMAGVDQPRRFPLAADQRTAAIPSVVTL
jgi:hypothetical protein